MKRRPTRRNLDFLQSGLLTHRTKKTSMPKTWGTLGRSFTFYEEV
jgi:hypothetical protein